MENLTTIEIDTAKEIIGVGLKKAAESLSFFMKEQITIQQTEFTVSYEKDFSIKDADSSQELYILSTEMRGELKGTCYLVFNQLEKDEICKMALPADIFNNPDKLKNMQEPLLLEIDNIISASVITQIANHLNKKVYGDVPNLTLMNAKELKNIITKQMKPDKLIIGFQTEFISSKTHFSPEFFWILDAIFLDFVKIKLLDTTI